MDALRRAEAEKKQAAKEKEEQQHQGDAGGPVSEESATSGNGPVETSAADEELGATVKLDRLPLPIASKQKSSADEVGQQLDSLNDLNVDFDETSPRIKLQGESAETTDPGSDTFAFSVEDNPSEIDSADDAGDFSINAEYATEKFAAPLTLEPLAGEGEEAADNGHRAGAIDSNDVAAQAAHEARESTVVSSVTDPLLALGNNETELETSSGQTAVAANTVFEAGSSGISKRVILWTLALGIAIIGVLVVSGVYYFQQTPTMRPIPAPVASVDIAQNRAPIVASQPALVPAESASQEEAPQPAAPEREPAQLADVTTLPSESSTPAVATDAGVLAPPSGDGTQKPLAEVEGMRPAETQTADSDAVSSAAFASPAAAAPEQEEIADQRAQVPTVNTQRLRIAKSIRAQQSSDKVAEAYAAYQRGDLATAKSVYQQALEIRPQDINALNGLGALALHDGDKETAHRFYSRVLKLDPNNPMAATAIFQIEGGVGNRVTESQLKLMLDEGGDPGTINFALGALYARHGRWNDAQLAYFEAVRHRPDNPDYLYNLAVSLDQIGQRKAALDYYQKALAASDDASGGFSESKVLSRIQAISSQRAVTPAP